MTNIVKAKSLKDYNASVLPRLQELCEPLNIFDISNFSYAKLTKDQKFFRVGNHQKYTELFLSRVCMTTQIFIGNYVTLMPFLKKKDFIFLMESSGTCTANANDY